MSTCNHRHHEADLCGAGQGNACACTTVDLMSNPYKADFPLLRHNPDIVFLDSAATAQRPETVVEAQKHFYETMNANPLRGLYSLSVAATDAISAVRQQIASLIGARDAHEIVFTRNTTESLNIVASSFGGTILKPGDEVLISIMEHHSNMIPWQQVCKRTGATLTYFYPDENGIVTSQEIEQKVTPRTKIVACAHVSNVLGVRLPIEQLARAVHAHGGYLVVDAAQSIPHIPLNVDAMGADFVAFSGHKAYGPFGVGVLWGKGELLDAMDPFLTGGEMIDFVSTHDATWAPVPEKFEAGTQDAAGIFATGAALDYLVNTGYSEIAAREQALVCTTLDRLDELDFVDVLGPHSCELRHGVISFNMKGVHPHDVASILDMHGICIRAGHHCAQPLLAWIDCEHRACCRASFAFYNDAHDIDAFIDGLKKAHATFGA